MTKAQRVRYEMFRRVRDFGIMHRERFPESSAIGKAFAVMAAAAADMEAHLIRLADARAEARRVKVKTRAAVAKSMKVIGATGRQLTEDGPGYQPFRLPSRKSAPVILAWARSFIEKAAPRWAEFVELGLPAPFLDDFRAKVDALEAAVASQQNGRGSVREAQAGIASALKRGLAALRTLDVAMTNAFLDDPTGYARWQAARDLPTPGGRPPVVVTPATAPTPAPPERPVPDKAQ